jgi:hypothetical protein
MILKDTSTLFNGYKSHYPYNAENSFKALTTLSKRNGRMLIHEGFFLWFSEYYALYQNMLNKLMNNDTYFPIIWKYFLAIMAVSTMKCDYLLKQLKIDFLELGGSEDWLIEGLASVPEKLRKLGKINNILAHQPWKLRTQDITVYTSLIVGNNRQW